VRRVLACGGRTFTDKDLIWRTLDGLDVSFLIVGGAAGADFYAEKWARERGVPLAIIPALWNVYGNSAGVRRNGWMLALGPELVVAFPGGKGTLSMVTLAREAGVEVLTVPG
jgi:hypothetical protein